MPSSLATLDSRPPQFRFPPLRHRNSLLPSDERAPVAPSPRYHRAPSPSRDEGRTHGGRRAARKGRLGGRVSFLLGSRLTGDSLVAIGMCFVARNGAGEKEGRGWSRSGEGSEGYKQPWLDKQTDRSREYDCLEIKSATKHDIGRPLCFDRSRREASWMSWWFSMRKAVSRGVTSPTLKTRLHCRYRDYGTMVLLGPRACLTRWTFLNEVFG